MACNGHCNHCPSHPGYVPAVGDATYTNPIPFDTNDDVRYLDFNELRAYISTESTRRSDAVTLPSTQTGSDLVEYLDWRSLRDAISDLENDAGAWVPAVLNDTNLALAENIQDEQYEAMVDQVDILRNECACDCNYACTCDCNYCVCNCNYACVCDCNYSDKNLKENINYM